MRLTSYWKQGGVTIVLGIIVVLILSVISGGNGDGAVTSGIFNAAIVGLIGAILFQSAVMVVCTLVIINKLHDFKR